MKVDPKFFRPTEVVSQASLSVSFFTELLLLKSLGQLLYFYISTTQVLKVHSLKQIKLTEILYFVYFQLQLNMFENLCQPITFLMSKLQIKVIYSISLLTLQ